MNVFLQLLSVIAIYIDGMIDFFAIYRCKIGASCRQNRSSRASKVAEPDMHWKNIKNQKR